MLLVAVGLWLASVIGCGGATGEKAGERALESTPGLDPRAIVVLGYLDRKQGGQGEAKWPRVAFAIGDGTLLLTAAHCVDDFQDSAKRPTSPDIIVASPYYGDVFDFEIVAVDREADLAVLRAPWPAHPALALADERELRAARDILIVSRPLEGQEKPYVLDGRPRAELLPVLTTDGAKRSQAVQLKGTHLVRKGWSGSPMVVPKTGKVVALASQINIRSVRRALFFRSKRVNVLGPDIQSIHRLLCEKGEEAHAMASLAKLETIEDAEQAFSLIMKYFESLFNRDFARAVESARELSRIRPASAQANLLLGFGALAHAYATDSIDEEWLEVVEVGFERAVQLDPNNAHVHASYGDFLLEAGRGEEALGQTEAALAADPNDRLALVNHVRLLTSREPARAVDSARRLIDVDPNNPYHWFYCSTALRHLGQKEDALEAARKAVALEPEGLFNGGLADALVTLDRFDDAERNYLLMTERCGCRQCWFRYARFLAYHRTGRFEDVERALAEGESRKTRRRISQEDRNAFRLQLLEKASPERAEVYARTLLDAEPNDASCWWHLASILRTLGRHDEAVDAARRAVELRPAGSFRPRLANCLAKADRLEEAQEVYDELLRLHPDRPRYWYWYAKHLHEYYPDREDEIREALEKAESADGQGWSVSIDEIEQLRQEFGAGDLVVPLESSLHEER